MELPKLTQIPDLEEQWHKEESRYTFYDYWLQHITKNQNLLIAYLEEREGLFTPDFRKKLSQEPPKEKAKENDGHEHVYQSIQLDGAWWEDCCKLCLKRKPKEKECFCAGNKERGIELWDCDVHGKMPKPEINVECKHPRVSQWKKTGMKICEDCQHVFSIDVEELLNEYAVLSEALSDENTPRLQEIIATLKANLR